MEQLIPRTLRRFQSYQSNLAKSAVFSQFQSMTKGHIELRLKNDPITYSFGYGKKVRGLIEVENDRFFSRFWSNGELGSRLEGGGQVGKQHVRALPEYLGNYLKLIADARVAYIGLDIGPCIPKAVVGPYEVVNHARKIPG